MQRIGAIFIAICMVMIAASASAIVHFRYGLSITEAASIGFGVLLTLLLVHYQITRVRDRMIIDEQMDDLTRLKLSLTKELQDVRTLAEALEGNVTERVEKEVDPILAELDVIGALVKQLAETCAELDERINKGDERVTAANRDLKAATEMVRQLETLLRTNLARTKAAPAPAVAPSDAAPPQAAHPSMAAMTAPHNAAARAEEGGLRGEPAFDQSAGDEAASDQQHHQQQRGNPVLEGLVKRREAPVTEENEQKVRRALALNQIEMHMQPIVTLPLRKPRYYEALARLKGDDGALITPDIFLPVCRKGGFLPLLDRLAMHETFKLLRRLVDRGRAVDCFCNLSLESLADSDFFDHMRDLFDQNRDLSEHIILEFSQADLRRFGMMEEETLQLLSSMGFRFSLDQVTNLSVEFEGLSRKGVRFIKVAAPVLTHREAGRGMDIHPADFSRVLSRKGLDLIVTHVESERNLIQLIDFNVQLAQGNHFAPAKALRPSDNLQTEQSVPQQGQPAPQSPQGAPQTAMPGRITAADMPPPLVHGAPHRQPAPSPDRGQGRGQGKTETESRSSRTLGDNPAVAKALKAMASQDDLGDTREQFRSVLAEAAGLIEPEARRGSSSAQATTPLPAAPQRPQASSAPTGLPASDAFELRHSTERGQFLDLGGAKDKG